MRRAYDLLLSSETMEIETERRQEYERIRRVCIHAITDRLIYIRNLGVMDKRLELEDKMLMDMLGRLTV